MSRFTRIIATVVELLSEKEVIWEDEQQIRPGFTEPESVWSQPVDPKYLPKTVSRLR